MKPKAYEPAQGYRFQIFTRNQQYSGREWEHCDYAKDRQEKQYLIAEYRMAYGAGWEFKSIMLPVKYWTLREELNSIVNESVPC